MRPSLPRLVAIASLALLAVQSAWGPLSPTPARLGIAALAAIVALAAIRRAPAAAPVASFVAFLLLALLTGLVWQPVLGLALLGWLATARIAPATALPARWWRLGRIPWPATLACGALTPLGLLLWLALARPDLADVVAAYVPALPLPALIAGALGFALLNAALEEIAWRGLVQAGLEPLVGVAGAAAIQAISFGIAHAHGVPRGVAGVLLAGGWGWLLGLLRQRAGGLLAPFLAHVVADATIAWIVLALAAGTGS